MLVAVIVMYKYKMNQGGKKKIFIPRLVAIAHGVWAHLDRKLNPEPNRTVVFSVFQISSLESLVVSCS